MRLRKNQGVPSRVRAGAPFSKHNVIYHLEFCLEGNQDKRWWSSLLCHHIGCRDLVNHSHWRHGFTHINVNLSWTQRGNKARKYPLILETVYGRDNLKCLMMKINFTCQVEQNWPSNVILSLENKQVYSPAIHCVPGDSQQRRQELLYILKVMTVRVLWCCLWTVSENNELWSFTPGSCLYGVCTRLIEDATSAGEPGKPQTESLYPHEQGVQERKGRELLTLTWQQ